MASARHPVELERLARQAAAGDELAFGRLAREVRPRLYRWALVQIGDPDDAEDIAQAALLRLQRGLVSFRFDSRVSTWLFTLVRSAAADWRRAAGRRRQRQYAYAMSQAAYPPATDAADTARLLRLVRDSFRDLPARQREVFDLVELQGEPPQAAAALLGLSPSTVRVHLLRARRAIRTRLLREGAAGAPAEDATGRSRYERKEM